MWSVWLLPFLLLLLTTFPCYSLQSLKCLNDFYNNVTCVWNSNGVKPTTACSLNGSLWIEMDSTVDQSTCNLMHLKSQGETLRTCYLVFEEEAFSITSSINMTVKCESPAGPVTMMSLKYDVKDYVKLPAPSLPRIENNSIMWTVSETSLNYIEKYFTQLELKKLEQQWEATQRVELKNNDVSMELPEERLEKGTDYQFRVRILVGAESFGGEWSNWSPVLTWRATFGTLSPKHSEAHVPDVVGLQYGIPALAFCLLIFLIIKIHKSNWLKRVPDPSSFFEGNGSFQKWPNSIFDPESFTISQCSEDISPIEISITKETDMLFKKECCRLSTCGDSSSQSSSFSNMGYFCSRHPGTYEACHVYFSYQPPGGSEKSKLGEEEEANGGPLQCGSSYEPLEQLGQPRHPDSEVKEDQQTEASEDEEDSPNDASTPTSSVGVLPLPPPYGAPPFPHHLPGLPHFPLPFLGFDRAVTLSETFTPWPLDNMLSKCSSLHIEPSSGGYMPVQDTCNS